MKNMVCRSVVLCCLVFMGTSFVLAQTVTFGTFPIPGFVDETGHGKFIDLTREIAKRAGIDVEIKVAPPKRMFDYFATQQVDVLFPAVDTKFPADSLPARSAEPIFMKKTYIFTRKGSPMLTSISELEGKTVGITAGYAYPAALTENANITLDSAPGDENNAKKLQGGRIDAFLVEEQSGLKAFEQLDMLDQVQYDSAMPIATEDVYYAFQQTDRGTQLAERVSQALTDMKHDGTFLSILQPEQE